MGSQISVDGKIAVVEGVDHNAELHMDILSTPAFKSGDYYTNFMELREKRG